MDMRVDKYTSDPWERNLGCRAHIGSACVPTGLSHAEGVSFCDQWADNHCGKSVGNGYLENWGPQNGVCKLHRRGDFNVYHGITPAEATHYASSTLFHGCQINFLLHPPAQIGGGGTAGCEWFFDSYCSGSASEYNVAVSERPDESGNKVCAITPK